MYNTLVNNQQRIGLVYNASCNYEVPEATDNIAKMRLKTMEYCIKTTCTPLPYYPVFTNTNMDYNFYKTGKTVIYLDV